MAIKELKFLLKHSGVYAIGNIFAQAAGFLLLPFYTHYLSPADYGIAALVETTISIIGVMASMGIGYSIAIFYSKKAEQKDKNLVISTAYVLAWAVCIVAIPLLCLISTSLSELLFKKGDYGIYFMLSSAALFIGLNLDIGLIYLNLKAKSLAYVILTLANSIMLISLNIYFIAFQKTGLIGIFYSSFIAKSFFAILITILILVHVKLKFSLNIGLQMIRFSIPLGLSTVFRILTQQSDKLFINYFFSPIETGIYAVAGKIANCVHVLISTTFLRSYQAIRFKINKDPNGPRIYGSIFEQYLLVIGSFALFIAMYSGEIISLMTTKDFYSATYYIPPMILAWIFFGMKYHLENGILISMKTKSITYIAAVSSLANVVFNFVLIPVWGVWGAVISSNISNIILTGASFFFSQKHYKIDIKWGRVVKLAICLAVFYALGHIASGLELGMAILVKALLLLTYYVTIFVLRLIEPGFFMMGKKAIGATVEEG